MSDVTGIQRLRQAIDNHLAAGEACFSLTMGEAYAICDEVEDELARVSWAQGVPAPKDADGEVVPLTTKVMYDNDGEELAIHSFTLVKEHDGYWWNVSYTMTKSLFGCAHVLNLIHLHCPDSWEQLEEDVRNFENDGACGYYGMETKTCTEGCPAAEDSQTPCSTIALEDVLRRAKALAGRGDD